jgi:hypothetical protein
MDRAAPGRVFNDLQALAPGVYFVRGEGRGAGDVGPIRKVVLTR